MQRNNYQQLTLRRAGKLATSNSLSCSGLECAGRRVRLELRPISSRALAKKTTFTSTSSIHACFLLKILKYNFSQSNEIRLKKTEQRFVCQQDSQHAKQRDKNIITGPGQGIYDRFQGSKQKVTANKCNNIKNKQLNI